LGKLEHDEDEVVDEFCELVLKSTVALLVVIYHFFVELGHFRKAKKIASSVLLSQLQADTHNARQHFLTFSRSTDSCILPIDTHWRLPPSDRKNRKKRYFQCHARRL